jgi:Right handed beta helix region
MIKTGSILLLLLAVATTRSVGDEIHVDPTKGSDENNGTAQAPLATLAQAVRSANELRGAGPITIKLFPGIYVLADKVALQPARKATPDAPYSIEAAIMPDTPNWSPDKMPVIESVSADNSTEQFPHSVGLLVASNDVTIRGLKFIGNPHPGVVFYYPITKENETLGGLKVSQCFFISEKNAVPIQGGVWVHGPGTAIDHCVFYNCRNAILLFKNVDGFSVTHTLIYGANESAVWMGPIDSNFVFKNNVVTRCAYFWVRPEGSQPAYAFSDCLITENDAYTGYYTKTGLVAVGAEGDRNFKETNVSKSGHVILVERTDEHLPPRYLNLAPESAGHELGAGIFAASDPR